MDITIHIIINQKLTYYEEIFTIWRCSSYGICSKCTISY